jgi:hypothetical protein
MQHVRNSKTITVAIEEFGSLRTKRHIRIEPHRTKSRIGIALVATNIAVIAKP